MGSIPTSAGTRASTAAYDRAVGEWLANGRRPAVTAAADLAVVELVLAFARHADAYYRRPDGTPTGEATYFRESVKPLVAMYGDTPAAAFGPVALAAVRTRMAADGLCRTSINARVRRIRQVFRVGGVAGELLPGRGDGGPAGGGECRPGDADELREPAGVTRPPSAAEGAGDGVHPVELHPGGGGGCCSGRRWPGGWPTAT